MMFSVGCSEELPIPNSDAPFETSDQSISFSDSSDSWATRGAVYDGTNLDEIEVFSYYTAQKEWSATTADDIDEFMINQLVTKASDVWSYTPLKYWPNNEDDKITFYAFAPYGDISYSTDADGKPVFNYILSTQAVNNNDLSASVVYDKGKDDGVVKFEMQHALARISISARTINAPDVDANDQTLNDDDTGTGEYNVKYTVNGVTFSGVKSKGTLSFDANDDVTWTLDYTDDSDYIEFIATQGKTLIDYTSQTPLLDYDDTTADAATNLKYTDVTMDDMGVFVLPQDFTQLTTTPTVQLRVRKSYKGYTVDSPTTLVDREIIYETEAANIPLPTDRNGWETADWINLMFTFDLGRLDEYATPLTVTSEILQWTTSDIDIDVHKNIYIYSSSSSIDVQTDSDGAYGEFTICTNYDYNLRVPHHREELDGAITSSRGFLFCSDDFNNYDNTYDVDTISGNKVFVPTLLSIDGTTEYQIVYATKSNITNSADIIYEYTDGYNTPSSRSAISGVSKTNIVYGSNGYAYILNSSNGLYRLLYLDPKQENALTAFNYENNTETGYHEIKLTNFATDGTVYFKIIIGAIGGVYTAEKPYSFDFSVRRSTRDDEGLYTSTAIDDNNSDNSYGVNKQGSDAVYILSLSVNTSHLTSDNNFTFDDTIGVEMISNGGGMITQLFPVSLTYNPN